ncbi:MAG: PEP-CTERM sorting domain-containing protein [Verrucomicrobiia bacterium]
MKPINKAIIGVVAALALSVVSSQAQLISLNFSSSFPGSTSSIQFNGAAHTFQFNASNSGEQWQIGSETGGTGSAINLFGGVFNGPFSYGPITTAGAVQYATVAAPPYGALSINDGLGDYLTGNVDWLQVETTFSIGGINAALLVNVTGLAYSGANADLNSLVTDGASGGSMNLSFQFSPAMTLTDLSTGTGPYTTSYSGSISAGSVPEPSSVAFILMGMGALVCSWRLKHSGNA